MEYTFQRLQGFPALASLCLGTLYLGLQCPNVSSGSALSLFLLLLLTSQIRLLLAEAGHTLLGYRQFAFQSLQTIQALGLLTSQMEATCQHRFTLLAQLLQESILDGERVSHSLYVSRQRLFSGFGLLATSLYQPPLMRVPRSQEAAELTLGRMPVFSSTRLLSQGRQPRLDLANDIVETSQITLGEIQPLLSFIALHLKLADARRILKECPALLGAQTERLVYQTLTDDRIGIMPNTSLSQEQEDILQAYPLPVHEIFAVARAEAPAGDRDFTELGRKPAVAVVENQSDFGHLGGGSPLAAGEDHIVALLAAQLAHALLAKYPAYAIGYVAVMHHQILCHKVMSASYGEIVYPPLIRFQPLYFYDLITGYRDGVLSRDYQLDAGIQFVCPERT